MTGCPCIQRLWETILSDGEGTHLWYPLSHDSHKRVGVGFVAYQLLQSDLPGFTWAIWWYERVGSEWCESGIAREASESKKI